MPTPTPPPERMYFNPAQMEAMVVAARYEYIIGGRGLGKSEGFDARALLRNVQAMPRSTGALLSPSYAKMKTQTFPAIAHALARWGYRLGVHYVAGVRPPRNLRYAEPRFRPERPENCLQFYNGTVVHMLSFDREMSANSLSLDWVVGPEAKFLAIEKLRDEVLPAIRGQRQFYGQCPWHGGQSFSTDYPTTAKGRWILQKAGDMDPALIILIKMVYLDMQEARQRGDRQTEAKALRELNRLRARATFFAVYSALDNLEILGEEWFHDQHRNLSPAVFNASILSLGERNAREAFYYALDEERNVYPQETTAFAEGVGYGPSVRPDCRWDADLRPDLPLHIGLDYNSAISCLAVGQVDGGELRTLRDFWVKTPRKLEDLVAAFCDYYRYQPCRDVFYYYDHTSVWTTAMGVESYSDLVVRRLREGGLTPIPVYLGRAMRHLEKFRHINAALSGVEGYLSLRFNEQGCLDLLAALELARVVHGGRDSGKKDKRDEKLPDSEHHPDERKTHLTDAWDSLFVGAQFHRREAGGGVSGVFL